SCTDTIWMVVGGGLRLKLSMIWPARTPLTGPGGALRSKPPRSAVGPPAPGAPVAGFGVPLAGFLPNILQPAIVRLSAINVTQAATRKAETSLLASLGGGSPGASRPGGGINRPPRDRSRRGRKPPYIGRKPRFC